MMQVVHSRFNALLSACVMSLIATAGWSQSLTWLGTLGGNHSDACGVSADGRVVVGTAANAEGYSRIFRWTAADGMIDLGTLPGGGGSWAHAVSADGRTVVGRADYYGLYNSYYLYPAHWTLGQSLRQWNWSAQGVSADGSVVVGTSNRFAIRWAAGGTQNLGTLPGGRVSVAYGVSADGAVVVGWSENAAWQIRAFRWTASGGMQDLGTLGGSDSWAYGVSADGSVVVGWAANAAGQYRAVRWTASGIEDLNITYASLLTNGSWLSEARAISPNGRYIVGRGYNAAAERWEAFLLDTQGTPPCTLEGDVNGDGIVDDADLLIVLFNFGNRCR